MCGIAGFIETSGRRGGDEMLATGRSMGDALALRGPDDSGEWLDRDSGLVFAHRRLAVIDLSPQGHQPMASPSGRYMITYNGEIYNYRELAAEARQDGAEYRGRSDTAVLLATFERLGVERTLDALTGMFAFALWDRRDRVLYLARDRAGEKPLYFGWFNGVFGFASELKSLRRHPGWTGEINRSSLASFLRYGYVSGPQSIYEQVYRLPPGCYFRIRPEEAARRGNFTPDPDVPHTAVPHPVRYWSLADVAEAPEARLDLAEQDAADELERKLSGVVRGQMISDVPLGVMLSGGVDSSLIAALMQSQSSEPVKTFTIGFGETRYNEAEHARRVADHLGTDHTELYVSPDEAREVIPLLPELYDEPFADSSQIPTYLVSRLARSRVTVALSGDAGDELFGGYTRYQIADKLWRRMQLLPPAARSAGASAMNRLPGGVKGIMMRLMSRLAGQQLQITGRSDQFERLMSLLSCPDFLSFYDSLLTHWKKPDLLVKGWREEAVARFGLAPPGIENRYEQMMFVDTMNYLPEDILTKVDRASMGVSLEVRVPLLDHGLMEWAWRLKPELRVGGGQGKKLLRSVLYRHVPRDLIERPKMGFGVPIDDWLRGPLRDWAEDLLSAERLRNDGCLEPGPIRLLWKEHLAGSGDWHYYLWDVLMFQAWRAANA